MFKRMHMPVRNILLPIILGLLWTFLCASNASAQKLTYAQSGQPEDPGLGLLQESRRFQDVLGETTTGIPCTS